MKLVKVLLSLTVAVLLASCTKKETPLGSADNPVKLFFVPSVDAKLLSEKGDIVKAYLEKETPYKFSFSVPTSYVAVVEAFGTARADIAILNTFGYLMANERYGAQALVTLIRFGSDTYQAQIIAKSDSKISSLKDLAGKKFAYVDPASTSGYLLPAKMFKDSGVEPKETVFANKHDNVVTMVYQGQVDAGATFYSPPHEGKIQDARRLVLTQYPDVEKKIKIVQLTDSIPNDPIVFRKDLPEDMKTKIADALVKFTTTPEGKDVMHAMYGADELVRSTDAKYDGVRDILKALGKSANDLMKK
jgi:phosphonate transport system substrate-binding protein